MQQSRVKVPVLQPDRRGQFAIAGVVRLALQCPFHGVSGQAQPLCLAVYACKLNCPLPGLVVGAVELLRDDGAGPARAGIIQAGQDTDAPDFGRGKVAKT